MAGKAIRKDFYMEIKKTYNRFLSIFLIVALGVAFFSGIRGAKPDMELSADRFFDECNLMDIRIIGTFGLTEEDIEYLTTMEGVLDAVGGYSLDVLTYQEENQAVLKLMSFSDKMNKAALSEGTAPKAPDECVVDKALKEQMGYAVGDTITVVSGNEDSLKDSLHRDTFTIAGFGTTPYYLSLERESSQIGSGEVDGFVLIPPENFAMEVYSDISVTAKGALSMVSYRRDYVELVNQLAEDIEDIADLRCQVRYDSILAEANEEIDKADRELLDAKTEAEDELSDAWDKLTDGKKEIKNGKKEIKDGEKKLSEAQEEILRAQSDLNKGRKEYEDGKKELAEAKKEYEDGMKKWEKGREELLKQRDELSKAEDELNDKEAELLEAKLKLEEQKKLLEDSRPYLSEEEYAKKAGEIAAYEAPILEGEKQIKAGRKTLAAGKKKLKEGEAALAEKEGLFIQAKKEIDKGQRELNEALAAITNGDRELEDGKAELSQKKKELSDAKKELKDGEKELKKNEEKYWDAKAEADEKIADAEIELEDARQALDDLEEPEWYVLDREKMQVVAEYGQNAERIGAIGQVFPVIFFLVAALVCLTTMTRMVEEERTQIGTLKALGYGKGAISAKYLLYAGIASIAGGIGGALAGQQILPVVIMKAYGIMYVNLPYVLTPFHYYYGISSILVVSACTILAAYFSCAKEMHETAAQLMRPEAPKAGKRVFLERLTFIWKHISFTKKASIRNLFRYKKRFFMTVIGIAGCMALLLVGFGVRDSIYNIGKKQYGELFIYSGSVTLKDGEGKTKQKRFYEFLDENVDSYVPVYETSVTVSANNTEKSAYLIVPEEEKSFSDYITLKDRKSGEFYSLDMAGDGIILTEKASSLLKLKAGDTMELKADDDKKVQVTVKAVTENYAMHYVYMTKETYESIFDKKLKPNMLYYLSGNMGKKEQKAFGEKVLSYPAASQVRFNTETSRNIENMLESLDIVVWVLIFSAGLLAFVVLYNLNNININERKRELATLKVLGFYDNEVASYVYRENVMLTVIGTAAGVFFGMVLHRYVVLTAEIDVLMFGRNIFLKSYLYSALLTMMFSGLINWIMYFKLKKINMVESLKSVE